MKIKISKTQWEEIGRKSRWMKKSQVIDNSDNSDNSGNQEVKTICNLDPNKVKEYENFITYIRDNFDCDQDAHKYGNMCRCCAAEKLIPKGLN